LKYTCKISREILKQQQQKTFLHRMFRPHKIALLSLLTSEAKKTPKKNECEISKQKHDDDEEQEK